ncbi:acetolactate decarboxylase [[Acholeplasma] multilocale]|uniref:acetolactate decarboxylase n=1 Tax=[Acholeplasma] multilocale TaxID=264638 RepID=UPI00047D236D|nr:acetolactate decarboxylase [[Acholeplasma] multilocale]
MENKIYMYSSIANLANGNYDGEIQYKELFQKGDHGLGTFDRLDGEMLAIDGEYFKLTSDGNAEKVNPNSTTPYAAVCNFKPNCTKSGLTLEDEDKLSNMVNEYIEVNGSQNIYAIKIIGWFEEVNTRAVAKQFKPYKKLNIASKEQTIHSIVKEQGTIFGFVTPKYLNTLSVEGMHLHFINEDKNKGGHLFNFKNARIETLEISKIDNIEFIIGKTPFEQFDIQKEIHEAEKAKS